jgi:ubiquinone/menaquinone biosynthesis C-methylase UbiE
MSEVGTRHAEQVAYWNGAGGAHWVAQQERTDLVMSGIAALALAEADARPGESVIDVGCGCGTTVQGLAQAVGPGGHVTALDVSGPMLGRARERLAGFANVDFVLADAASHILPPAMADLVFSRFGVMFFGDPTTAFTRLRRAIKPRGRLVFACWRAPALNPWMAVPLNAAYQHVPRLPQLGPEDPGPFSFADPERVRRILTAAGFAEPVLKPVDLALDLAAGGGLDAAVNYVLAIGAASRALEGQPDSIRAAAAGSIRRALVEYAEGPSVRLPAAIWLVRALLP